MEQNKKVAIREDGTVEYGKLIISYLKSLNGFDRFKLSGYSYAGESYYFIDDNNEINYKMTLPEGYTLIDLHDKVTEEVKEDTTFKPDWYMVSNDNITWVYRFVLGFCPVLNTPVIIAGAKSTEDNFYKKYLDGSLTANDCYFKYVYYKPVSEYEVELKVKEIAKLQDDLKKLEKEKKVICSNIADIETQILVIQKS